MSIFFYLRVASLSNRTELNKSKTKYKFVEPTETHHRHITAQCSSQCFEIFYHKMQKERKIKVKMKSEKR